MRLGCIISQTVYYIKPRTWRRSLPLKSNSTSFDETPDYDKAEAETRVTAESGSLEMLDSRVFRLWWGLEVGRQTGPNEGGADH